MTADTKTRKLPSQRKRPRPGQVVIIGILTVFVSVGLFPFLFMLLSSFKSNEQFYNDFWGLSLPLHWSNYATAWHQVSPYLFTSLLVAAAATVGTLLFASVSAYVLARFHFFGRNVIFGLFALLMMIPGIASLIPMFIFFRDLGLLNTYWVLIIPQVSGGVVLAVILMRTFFAKVPQELFDAAMVDGASAVRVYFSIMLPLSLPIVGTVGLVTVINVWNDYFWPLLTITDDSLRTVPVGLSFFQGQNLTEWGPLFAGYTISSLPLLLLFVFFSKWFLAGVQGGIPGAGK